MRRWRACLVQAAGLSVGTALMWLLAAFEEDISSYGIGSVPEIYDGDPPHAQRGAISQAWSVGALLRIRDMIDYWKERE